MLVPIWGAYKGKPVFIDYASNSVTFGPAGSGKSTGGTMPTILAVKDSKIYIDFKGEISCTTKSELEKRGESVHILNLGGILEDTLGTSARINILDVIIDNFERPSGLTDVTSDLRELSTLLSPDPVKKGGGGDQNKFFTEGERSLIEYIIVQNILIHHRNANLGQAYQLANKVDELHKEAQWVCGRLEQNGVQQSMPIQDLPWTSHHDPEDVQNFIEYHRGMAAAICDLIEGSDSRTFQSFVTGARSALKSFNITTRAAKVLTQSTFRFAETKESDVPVTIGIVVDASPMEAQKPLIEAVQWVALTELKRAKNKQRPVYCIYDECTNYRIFSLSNLLTFGRGYGIRLHLIMQSVSAFVAEYGEEEFNILWSETEIKQFLPQQREPRILKLIQKLLAEQSIIAKDHNGRRGEGMGGYGYKEDARSLMTEDEIRRTDKTILVIRNNKPLQVDLPSIAAIKPWRDQIGINPFYGKPYRLPIKLHIASKHLNNRRQS